MYALCHSAAHNSDTLCNNAVPVPLTTLSHCVHAGEEVPPPGAHYDKTSAPQKHHCPRATAEDLLCSFLRSSPTAKAIEFVKNKNVIPKKVITEGEGLPEDCLMPEYFPWDNHDQCILTFIAGYLKYQGLVFSDPMARQLLIYCYYGTYFFVRMRKKGKDKTKEKVTKEMPIIHALYNKCSQNQTRALSTIKSKFKTFIELLAKKPHYCKFLGDKGEGDAPEEYNVAIEMGIRGYARDPQALSKNAIISAQEYDGVQQWRKRAIYECLCRVIEVVKACKWFACSWKYYKWRLDRGITFDKRHWPLCQKSTVIFKGKVPDLKEWSATKKKKRKRKASEMKTNKQRYDAEAGCFIAC